MVSGTHTIPIRITKDMGMVWEQYGKLTITGSHYWGSLESPLKKGGSRGTAWGTQWIFPPVAGGSLFFEILYPWILMGWCFGMGNFLAVKSPRI